MIETDQVLAYLLVRIYTIKIIECDHMTQYVGVFYFKWLRISAFLNIPLTVYLRLIW